MYQHQINEATRRFNFLCNYKPDKPTNYKPQTLSEIKGNDKTIFTYNILQEMQNGVIDQKNILFEILHNVKDILLTEAYNTFSDFMSKLKTDKASLESSDNIIRMVFERFKSGNSQNWKLINPDEYLRCIQQYSYQKPQSGAYDDYWTPRIMGWVANAKDNIAQLAANSYLCNGPTLDRSDENSNGQNLHAILWYNLTGDEDIPYKPGDCTHYTDKEKNFMDKYWGKFYTYTGTNFSVAYETDSALDGFFNIVAEFDKNYSDPKKLFVTLDRLKNMCHNRGSFAHLFMKGGNEACTQISNS